MKGRRRSAERREEKARQAAEVEAARQREAEDAAAAQRAHEETAAATKIQAGFRGMQARRLVAAARESVKDQQQDSHESEVGDVQQPEDLMDPPNSSDDDDNNKHAAANDDGTDSLAGVQTTVNVEHDTARSSSDPAVQSELCEEAQGVLPPSAEHAGEQEVTPAVEATPPMADEELATPPPSFIQQQQQQQQPHVVDATKTSVVSSTLASQDKDDGLHEFQRVRRDSLRSRTSSHSNRSSMADDGDTPQNEFQRVFQRRNSRKLEADARAKSREAEEGAVQLATVTGSTLMDEPLEFQRLAQRRMSDSESRARAEEEQNKAAAVGWASQLRVAAATAAAATSPAVVDSASETQQDNSASPRPESEGSSTVSTPPVLAADAASAPPLPDESSGTSVSEEQTRCGDLHTLSPLYFDKWCAHGRLFAL